MKKNSRSLCPVFVIAGSKVKKYILFASVVANFGQFRNRVGHSPERSSMRPHLLKFYAFLNMSIQTMYEIDLQYLQYPQLVLRYPG